MKKIGLILTVHNDIAYLFLCLKNWISYREHNSLLISVIDVCFQENGEKNSTDGSIQFLKQYKNDNKIDFFEVLPPGLKEHESRNVALKYLLNQGVDTIISIGSDEIFLLKEIDQIFKYVNKEEFIAVFKIPYKNYTFSKWQYTLGFCPNRIWRVNYNGWKINGFAWDDDQEYINDKGEKIFDKNLPIKIIPNILIKHYTWCDYSRSKEKILYQSAHFSHGAGCGFRVNKDNTNIEFNIDHYKQTGQAIPELYDEIAIHTTKFGKFVLEPEDGVCRVIRDDRFWDEWLLPYFDVLSKDSIALDIGSHIGFHTVYLAKICKHVYSFEPQIINYDRLVKNVELNNLSNVTCHNVALYSKERKMAVNNILQQKDIRYNDGVQACSLTLYENDGDIQAKTLDSYNLPKIDFIKADAEGSEFDIFLGGMETIKKYRPTIIFEYSRIGGVHDHPLGEYEEFFKSLNYKIKEIAGQNYLASP
ncbi:MAG: FkbM family methyltransferase [Nanoarchaeota archaeon]